MRLRVEKFPLAKQKSRGVLGMCGGGGHNLNVCDAFARLKPSLSDD